MSTCTASLWWVVLVTLLTFDPSSETTPAQDRNLASMAFNFMLDPCYSLGKNPTPAGKEAADLFCKMAFEALDRTGGNSCRGWRLPECRRYSEHFYFQCSCKISTCDEDGIKRNRVYVFSECASMLQEEYNTTGMVPVPSANFWEQYENVYEDALRVRESRHYRHRGPAPTGTAFGVGTSRVSRLPSSASILGGRGVGSSQGAGSWGGPPARDDGASTSAAGESQARQRRRPTCEICGRDYPSVERLEFHMRLHEGGTYCEYCGKRFPNKAALLAHYGPCVKAHRGSRDKPSRWAMW